MTIEKTPFRKYQEGEVKNKPLVVKLNEEEKEMVELGGYALNMHSKGGILKQLARVGLKVILGQFGLENMHKLTRGDRTRLILEKPRIYHFREKVNDD